MVNIFKLSAHLVQAQCITTISKIFPSYFKQSVSSSTDVFLVRSELNENKVMEIRCKLLLKRQQLNTPREEWLPNSEITTPYVFIGDIANLLFKNLKKPYPRVRVNEAKNLFNTKLSRARNTFECRFGILTMKWRIFSRAAENTTDARIKAVCTLRSCILDKEERI